MSSQHPNSATEILAVEVCDAGATASRELFGRLRSAELHDPAGWTA